MRVYCSGVMRSHVHVCWQINSALIAIINFMFLITVIWLDVFSYS